MADYKTIWANIQVSLRHDLKEVMVCLPIPPLLPAIAWGSVSPHPLILSLITNTMKTTPKEYPRKGCVFA